MTTVDLETVRENLAFMLDSFRRLPQPTPLDRDYADAAMLAWQRCRQLAIAVLLTEADSTAFFAQLAAAAVIRRDALAAMTADPGPLAEHRRAGDLAGFADALVAGDLDLAREIAALCAPKWSTDYEYEDDYWYARILHALLASGFAAGTICEDELAALRRAAEDAPPGQVQVAAALLERDSDAFAEALQVRTEEHRAWFAKKGEGIIADPDEYATERHVFIEGLALKVIANKLGMQVSDESPLMPREACVFTSS